MNSSRISKFLQYGLLIGAEAYIIAYLYLVFFRIQYPFELEWMEGGSVDHVSRILSGQKLYVTPSLEFIPYVYTPLYFYLSAFVSTIVGVGLMPLRFVSFIASLGSFLFIFLIVKQETKNEYASILATCLFAATFQISGAWFDLARVDSLFLFFLLVAIYLIRFKTSPGFYFLAGVFISLSFLTKQTALIISLPIMFYCILVDLRRSYFFVGTVVAIIGGSTLLLNYIHDGWYNYYILDLPGQHPIIKRFLVEFWLVDIVLPLAIAFSISIFYLLDQLSDFKKDRLFYLLLAIGMLGGAWFSRLHSGGVENVLFPAYAIISILFGLGLNKALEYVQIAPAAKQELMRSYIYLVCIIQFASLVYNPLSLILSQKDAEQGREFINKLAQIEGEILLPYHGYLPTLAGKRSFAQHMAIVDILRADEGPIKNKLINEIKQAIQEKRFSAIILNNNEWFLFWFSDDIEKHYVKQPGRVFEDAHVFWTVTGMRTRPEFVYIPRRDDTN